jgi:hypothetical protein
MFIRTTTIVTHRVAGLGHGISNCPKLEDTLRKQVASHRTAEDGGGY